MQRNQLKNPANIYPTWSKLQKPLLPSGDQTWQWRTTPGLQQIIFPARNLQVVPAFSSPQCWMTQRRVVNNMFFDGENLHLLDGCWWILMDVDGCWWTLRLKSLKNPPFTEHFTEHFHDISTCPLSSRAACEDDGGTEPKDWSGSNSAIARLTNNWTTFFGGGHPLEPSKWWFNGT